jgi:hypothetical protein
MMCGLNHDGGKWDAGKSHVNVSSEMTRLTRHRGVSRYRYALLALYIEVGSRFLAGCIM